MRLVSANIASIGKLGIERPILKNYFYMLFGF